MGHAEYRAGSLAGALRSVCVFPVCAVRNTHSLCAIAGTWHNLAHTRHIAGWSGTQLAEHGLQLEPGGAAGRSQDRGPDGETEGRLGLLGGRGGGSRGIVGETRYIVPATLSCQYVCNATSRPHTY